MDTLWVINGMHRASSSLLHPIDEEAQDQVFSQLDLQRVLGPPF